MKLRLKSHSMRFRITAEEMAALESGGVVSGGTAIPTSSGDVVIFKYEVRRDAGRSESGIDVNADGFTLSLSDADFAELAAPDNEAVYLRRYWKDSSGREQRCVIYVERDKPKKHKHKKSEKHSKPEKDTAGADIAGAEVASPLHNSGKTE